MLQLRHCVIAVIALIVITLSSIVLAESEQVGLAKSRYVSVALGPTGAQKNPLDRVVEIQIPQRITTVGAAIEYTVLPHGFRLHGEGDAAPEQSLMVSLPLPDVHRALGPLKLIDALQVLGGEAFILRVNPVKRTVSYVLNPDYRQCVTAEDIEQAHQKWLRHKEQSRIHAYGPVKLGETLSRISIALSLHGMTLDQRMVQLYHANLNAFDNNMNSLKVGEMLSIPPADLNEMSVREASQFVDKHYRRWKQRVPTP